MKKKYLIFFILSFVYFTSISYLFNMAQIWDSVWGYVILTAVCLIGGAVLIRIWPHK